MVRIINSFENPSSIISSF